MLIADICTRDVIHTGPDASLRQAAELMRKTHVGALVVVSRPNHEIVPIGMLTDRDIVLSAVAPGVDLESVTVGDAMSQRLATCNEDEDIFDAIATMRQHGVRRLPVLNANGGLAGMVAADDVYGAIGMHMSELSQAFVREQVHEMEIRT